MIWSIVTGLIGTALHSVVIEWTLKWDCFVKLYFDKIANLSQRPYQHFSISILRALIWIMKDCIFTIFKQSACLFAMSLLAVSLLPTESSLLLIMCGSFSKYFPLRNPPELFHSSSGSCLASVSISRPLGLICMVIGQEVSHWVLILRNLPAGIASLLPLRFTTLSSIVPLITLPVKGLLCFPPSPPPSPPLPPLPAHNRGRTARVLPGSGDAGPEDFLGPQLLSAAQE